MSRPEKVENNLHRIEGSERNLYEKGVPVAHGTVPETWEFESLEFASLITLGTDESRILIHILEEVETLSLIVVEAAYDVNRIEMCRRSECVARVVIRHVDLNAFKDLERSRTVLLGNDERTAARLALILHHSGNSYRTVEFLTKSGNPFLRSLGCRNLDAENILEEGLDVVAECDCLRCRSKIFIHRIIARHSYSGVS